jgi:hypothetical protein
MGGVGDNGAAVGRFDQDRCEGAVEHGGPIQARGLGRRNLRPWNQVSFRMVFRFWACRLSSDV